VYVNFLCEQDKLLIMVRDFGKGCDPLRLKQPKIRERLKALQRRGWGLILIRRLMDEVEFVEVQPGTHLRMTKYRDPSLFAGSSGFAFAASWILGILGGTLGWSVGRRLGRAAIGATAGVVGFWVEFGLGLALTLWAGRHGLPPAAMIALLCALVLSGPWVTVR